MDEAFEDKLLLMNAIKTIALESREEIEVLLEQVQNMETEKFDMEEKIKLKEQDIVRLKEEKDSRDLEISILKQEREMAQSRHESHCIQLEAKAKEHKLQLETKSKELECIQQTYQSFVTSQVGAVQELSAALESTKREVLRIKRSYSEDMKYLGLKLKTLTDAAEKYHDVLDENQKLYNEVQDLKEKCRFCTGSGTVVVELGGDEKEVSNCINCEGKGSFTCTACQGSGIQPRYLDRREFKDDD